MIIIISIALFYLCSILKVSVVSIIVMVVIIIVMVFIIFIITLIIIIIIILIIIITIILIIIINVILYWLSPLFLSRRHLVGMHLGGQPVYCRRGLVLASALAGFEELDASAGSATCRRGRCGTTRRSSLNSAGGSSRFSMGSTIRSLASARDMRNWDCPEDRDQSSERRQANGTEREDRH